MKKHMQLFPIYLSMVLLFHCIYGCKEQAYPKTIVLIDSLSGTNQERAMSKLSAIKDTIVAEDQRTPIFYQPPCIKTANKASIIDKMQLWYNYQLKEKENQKLKEINATQKAEITFLIFTFVLSVTGLFTYFQYSKRKREQKKEQYRKLEEAKEKQYKVSVQLIEENKKLIHKLKLQLQTTKSENKHLYQELTKAQKKLIENTNKQIETDTEEQLFSEVNLKQSDIFFFFHQAAKNKTKVIAADWTTLQTAVDHTYKDFTKRLCALYPQISKQELHICLLLKISIPAIGIANLTMRSKQAVTSSRKKLYEKIYRQQGSPEQWDRFIQTF